MALKKEKTDSFEGFLAQMQKVLPKEKFDALKAVYTNPDGSLIEEAVDHTAQHIMLRQDYFSSNTELRRKEAELENQRKALEQDLADIAAYETKIGKYETYLQSNNVSRADYEAAQSELATLRGWQTAVQNRVNELEVGSLLDGIDPAQPANPPAKPSSPNSNGQNPNGAHKMPTKLDNNGTPGTPLKYVTEAQLVNKINENSLAPVMLSAQMADIAQEYFNLTGKVLENQEKFLLDGISSGKQLKDYANEVLNLTELRTTKAKTDYENELKRRVDAELAKITSEGRLPTSTAPRGEYTISPFIQQMLTGQSGGDGNDVLSAKPQSRPGAAAARATEAYLSGKYSGQRLQQ